jgi:prevent-host-death family protein
MECRLRRSFDYHSSEGAPVARRIPLQAFRDSIRRVLRTVRDGETIEITEHGEVVAVLEAPGESTKLGSTMRRSTMRGSTMRGSTMQGSTVRGSTVRRSTGRFSDIEGVELDHPIQPTLDDLRGDL